MMGGMEEENGWWCGGAYVVIRGREVVGVGAGEGNPSVGKRGEVGRGEVGVK